MIKILPSHMHKYVTSALNFVRIEDILNIRFTYALP